MWDQRAGGPTGLREQLDGRTGRASGTQAAVLFQSLSVSGPLDFSFLHVCLVLLPWPVFVPRQPCSLWPYSHCFPTGTRGVS